MACGHRNSRGPLAHKLGTEAESCQTGQTGTKADPKPASLAFTRSRIAPPSANFDLSSSRCRRWPVRCRHRLGPVTSTNRNPVPIPALDSFEYVLASLRAFPPSDSEGYASEVVADAAAALDGERRILNSEQRLWFRSRGCYGFGLVPRRWSRIARVSRVKAWALTWSARNVSASRS
jgi:hypothetical protein